MARYWTNRDRVVLSNVDLHVFWHNSRLELASRRMLASPAENAGGLNKIVRHLLKISVVQTKLEAFIFKKFFLLLLLLLFSRST